MSAPSLRHVRDTIKDASGVGVNCQITITWPAFTTYDGFSVGGGQSVVSVYGGSLDVTLSPSTYAILYTTPRGQTSRKKWAIPQTPGPFLIADIESNP